MSEALSAEQERRFEAWAVSEGLIRESHGVLAVNAVRDVAKKAWLAALSAPASQERADAGKDAARYQWFRQGKLLWVTVPVRDKHVKYLLGHKPEAGFADALDQAIDAAILAANKEQK
jgi:hypothetical protein